MVLVTSPFSWHHAVTLTFDLLQGQICCRTGDHSSPNLLFLTSYLYERDIALDGLNFAVISSAAYRPAEDV